MINEIHISEKDLAKRWGLSPKTLQRWRWVKSGPAYIKIGGRIRYTADSIKEFEDKNIHLESVNVISKRSQNIIRGSHA